jgi:hypothetical protein
MARPHSACRAPASLRKLSVSGPTGTPSSRLRIPLFQDDGSVIKTVIFTCKNTILENNAISPVLFLVRAASSADSIYAQRCSSPTLQEMRASAQMQKLS